MEAACSLVPIHKPTQNPGENMEMLMPYAYILSHIEKFCNFEMKALKFDSLRLSQQRTVEN
jgi:hypothetical protein